MKDIPLAPGVTEEPQYISYNGYEKSLSLCCKCMLNTTTLTGDCFMMAEFVVYSVCGAVAYRISILRESERVCNVLIYRHSIPHSNIQVHNTVYVYI